MSYQIGQVVRDTSASYMTDVSCRQTTLRMNGYEGTQKVFYDFALEGSFSSKNIYYLRTAIKRKTNMNMTVTIALYKSNEKGSYEKNDYQTIDAVTVERYLSGVTDEYAEFELMFTPDDAYSYLAFILSRGSIDYTSDTPVSLDRVIWNGTDGDLCTVTNILPVPVAEKIGVQSRPGTLITVNNENIRLGRSGMYEVNNGVKITNVGIVAPNGAVEPFILDYAYDA